MKRSMLENLLSVRKLPYPCGSRVQSHLLGQETPPLAASDLTTFPFKDELHAFHVVSVSVGRLIRIIHPLVPASPERERSRNSEYCDP